MRRLIAMLDKSFQSCLEEGFFSFFMSILSWNVRGLGRPEKRIAVRCLVSSQKQLGVLGCLKGLVWMLMGLSRDYCCCGMMVF